MTKRAIQTLQAPKAVGPYSQAIEGGPFLYSAGQVAIDPAIGKLIEGSVREQTEQVMKNLEAILEAAGLSTSDVVKTTTGMLLRFASSLMVLSTSMPSTRGRRRSSRMTCGRSVSVDPENSPRRYR